MADALAVNAEEGRFKPAKVVGEVAKTFDPAVSEWGNPFWFIPEVPPYGGREPGELKYLSTRRKRNRRDSPSKRRAKREQPKLRFV